MRNSQKIVSLFFIAAIAVVFVLQFGPASSGFNRPVDASQTVAATVNGREIPLHDFNRALSNQVEMFRAQGMSLTDQQLRQFGIPQRLLDQMVSGELLAQAAEQRGIQASDAEILDLLHKNDLFKRDGTFHFETYRRNVLTYFQKPPTAYELDLRRQLAAQKLLEMVTQSANVSEEEVKARFFREGNKAQVTFVRFDPSHFAQQVKAIPDAEVASFAKERQKEISDSYAANAFLYRRPEQVRARHVLIKSEKEDPPEQREAARKKAQEIRAKVEGGLDFAQAAKEFSEDEGSKNQGGDLGLNERANWVKPFADAAFALEPGKVSEVVESEFGFHLIKVDEKVAATERSLEDASQEIARQLLTREKARQLAQAAAQKALAAAQKGKKLADLHPEAKPRPGEPPVDRPTAVSTGSFVAEGDTVPQLGPAPDLSREIFAAQGPLLLPRVYEQSEGFVVAEVTERKRPSEEDFTAQRDSLREDARRAKEFELRDSFIRALKKSAQVKTNPDIGAVSTES